MPTFFFGARTNAQRRDDWVACEMWEKDMILVNDDCVRNTCLTTFSLSSFKLAEIFALDGDF